MGNVSHVTRYGASAGNENTNLSNSVTQVVFEKDKERLKWQALVKREG